MNGERVAGKLPTLAPLLDEAARTARRFPAVLIAATACAVAAICMMDEIGPGWLQERLLVAASLGLPLLTAASLAAEREHSRFRQLLWFAGALAVLAGVFVVWPGLGERERALRYVQLSVAGHLAVAFLPVPRGLPNAFWQFNRTLFQRFIVAGITSAVTWVGLALALAALDKLFGVDIPPQGYGRLWVLSAFVLNTWLFLGGVPQDLGELERQRDYPRGLRVFAQYTLLPLVSLYLVILTAYLAKVLVTWDWPSGWIGWLVSSVAATGIFTLLLVHPVAAEQKWVAVFARDFWIAVLPAIVMLWLAIKQRVDQYGMTEPRYFLLLLSLWLFGLALFYVVTRSSNIRVIPSSLCVVALITFAGPLSAYFVSERSQFGRLRAILERTHVVSNGRLVPGPHQLSADDHREVRATIDFLADRGAAGKLKAWLPASADSLARLGRWSQAQAFMDALGLPYEHPTGSRRQFELTSRSGDAAISVRGYDWLVPIVARNDSLRATAEVTAMLSADGKAIEVTRSDTVLIALPLDSVLARAPEARTAAPSAAMQGRRMPDVMQGRRLAPEAMTLHGDNQRVSALAYLALVAGEVQPVQRYASRVTGNVLLSIRH